ncbi:MAG: glycosyltransferase [Candidatus Pelagibacterales bacterium]|nr:MAG: glycosyltransferase [Pelagibacterales bacterium]
MNTKNNHQPLVSIIMNCYNGETYLHKSIQSVLEQTYKNWELIFWDNRSEDKSAEIFKSYEDERLKYYYAPKHSLLYEARNEAIKKSSGELIAFLDTDDFWEKDKLDLQIPFFKDLKVGVVYGNLFIVNEKLNTKKLFLKGEKPRGFILDNLLKDYCTGLVSLVIRKSLLDKHEAFDRTFDYIGDFDLMIRMSSKYKFEYVDKPIASWRSHWNNATLLKKNDQINELKIWTKKMKNYSDIFNNKNFTYIDSKINNLEIVSLILDKRHKEARFKIKKVPFSLKKIKFLLALILPVTFVKRFIQF